MYFATGNSPSRKDMQTKSFLAYPQQVAGKGKTQVIQTMEMSDKVLPAIQKVWKPLWEERR